MLFRSLVDVMRVKDKDSNYTVISKDWGFCDGTHFFMRLGSNYFRLFKTGDTYELFGTPDLYAGSGQHGAPITYFPSNVPVSPGAALAGAALGAALQNNKTHLGKLKPLQLDMETGTVY